VLRCYLLAVCVGSSLDQVSNNLTLFNLVEQVNVPASGYPVDAVLPLEIHAYFHVPPVQLQSTLQLRFALVAQSGLETTTEVFEHRVLTQRYRTRTPGLPLPPVVGAYELRLDWRFASSEAWTREPLGWPLTLVEADPHPVVTH
jgi:hypothetical protein